MKSWQEQKDMIEAEIAKFPATFKLRAFPGEEFFIKASDSFVQDDGEIQLYVHGPHGALARGTATELRKEIVK